MKYDTAFDKAFYRKRLKEFLSERHPCLKGNKSIIEVRSAEAHKQYVACIMDGMTPLTASARADAVLYEGLLFSRYDTLRCILATDYPLLSPAVQRKLALELEMSFEDIFSRYNLDDGILVRREYNHLIVELMDALRTYFTEYEMSAYKERKTTNNNL